MPELKAGINSKDLLLLLLYYTPKGRTVGKTRLTKMVFLFEKEIWAKFKWDKVFDQDSLPQFSAYYFGPFSRTIHQDIDFLANVEFISLVENSSDKEEAWAAAEELRWWEVEAASTHPTPDITEYTEYSVNLEPRGAEFVEKRLLRRLSETQIKGLKGFVDSCTRVPLASLLRYVYEKYPEFAENSKIREHVTGRH